MKCPKCGFEDAQGRSCPKCGENLILINEDYYKRRKEWEEKNAPREEKEEPAKKLHLSPEIKKRIAKIFPAVILVILVIYGIVTVVCEYMRTHVYQVGFASGTERIFSCDGAFAYEKPAAFAGVSGERRQTYCSMDGMAAAAVIYEEQTGKYCLYVSYKEESRLAYETENVIDILRVNSDGSVLLREMAYGNYDIVTECHIIEVADNIRILAETDMDIIETGRDKQYCFYADGQALVFENGKSDSAYVEDADEIVFAGNTIFYRKGDVLYNVNNEQLDIGVQRIFHLFGTDELFYAKEGSLILFEAGTRQVEIAFADTNSILSKTPVFLRRGSKLYFQCGMDVVILDRKGRITQKSGAYPYLYVK